MLSGNRFTSLSRAATRLSPVPVKSNSPLRNRTFSSSPAHKSSLPRIVNPSLWASVVPKFLRDRKPRDDQDGKPKAKEWNPATYFIVMAILIGSQAIHTLTLRKDFESYVRTTDAKINLLREVIEKVKRGEEVDVRGILGTGNPKSEAEWSEAIKQVTEEEEERKPKQQKQPKQKQARTDTKPEPPKAESTGSNDSSRPLAEDGAKPGGNFY